MRVLGLGLLLAAPLTWLRAGGAEQEILRLVQDLLNEDCASGTGPGAFDRAIERAPEIEPRLVEVLELGPPTAMLEDLHLALAEEWALRQDLLAQGTSTGLSIENRQRAAAETWAEYRARGEARLRASARERAAFALAAIGTSTAKDALREISRHADEETRAAIQRARRAFQPQPVPGANRQSGIPERPRVRREPRAPR